VAIRFLMREFHAQCVKISRILSEGRMFPAVFIGVFAKKADGIITARQSSEVGLPACES